VAQARQCLVELREDAAGALAFERAGRIQQELSGLDWVTCTQRVTTLGPAELDACGWSDGVLSIFAVRAGRLCGWSQRRCPAARAAVRLAATPPAWADFAQQNAELAARLWPAA
jgi:excinuclease ABC subunit C